MSDESQSSLQQKHCKPCEGGVPPLAEKEIRRLLGQLEGWELVNGQIEKTYPFKNYYEVIAFVNAVAWISHAENHHPELAVGFRKCTVRYSTHAIGGLSENDFICAARVDHLLAA